MSARTNPYLEEIARLRERVEYLEAENHQLKLALREEVPPIPGIELTASERTVLGALLARDPASKDAVYNALYFDRIDDPPAEKITDVLVCKLRKKLTRKGIEVETVWGTGWRLTPEMKARVRALIDGKPMPSAVPATEQNRVEPEAVPLQPEPPETYKTYNLAPRPSAGPKGRCATWSWEIYEEQFGPRPESAAETAASERRRERLNALSRRQRWASDTAARRSVA